MSFLADIFTGGGQGSGTGRSEQFSREGVQEIRRLLGQTQADFDPFIQAGTRQLPGLERGATVGGLDETLAQIFSSDTFGALRDERTRAVQGGLSAGGLTRSGTATRELSQIPVDIGLQLEQLLTGRSQQLAGQGLGAASNLGSLRGQAGGQIGNLLGGQAGIEGQATLAEKERRQQQSLASQNLFLPGIGKGIGSGLEKAGFAQLATFFSDPTLKENVVKIGEIGPLNLYEWDWIERAKGTLIEKCPNIGFMANEVKEIFPELVKEYCGYQVLFIEPLLDRLEAV